MDSTQPRRVLLVEDNPRHLDLYRSRLEQEGFEVVAAGRGEEALECLSDDLGVVITDLYLPTMDGIELMGRIHEARPGLPVIVLTSRGEVEQSRELIQRGAFDYVQKTGSFKDFLLRVGRAFEHQELSREVDRLRGELQRGRQLIQPSDPAMLQVQERADAVARTSYPVLLTGESGTGKEVFARRIHERSVRAGKPFVSINCGAIPRELFESELFGHLRGSFTGATHDHSGLFEEADGGTILLDEIGEIPAEHQVKLLRVLQEGEIRRVGDTRSRKVDVRVLAATNRDLEEDVRNRRFREDLYYRIQVTTIHLPPLRARREDILPLAHHFLKMAIAETEKHVDGFARGAVEAIRGYDWPGNIRELANRVRQALIISSGRQIEATDLELPPPGDAPDPSGGDLLSLPLPRARLEFERRYLDSALDRAGGNVSQAARLSGKHRSEFYALLKRHEIDPAAYRRS